MTPDDIRRKAAALQAAGKARTSAIMRRVADELAAEADPGVGPSGPPSEAPPRARRGRAGPNAPPAAGDDGEAHVPFGP